MYLVSNILDTRSFHGPIFWKKLMPEVVFDYLEHSRFYMEHLMYGCDGLMLTKTEQAAVQS